MQLEFYYYATCKCAAPESWHALNRYASALEEGNKVSFSYVQTQTGYGRERISALLGPDIVAHPAYIARHDGPLVLVSALTDEGIGAAIAQALA